MKIILVFILVLLWFSFAVKGAAVCWEGNNHRVRMNSCCVVEETDGGTVVSLISYILYRNILA